MPSGPEGLWIVRPGMAVEFPVSLISRTPADQQIRVLRLRLQGRTDLSG